MAKGWFTQWRFPSCPAKNTHTHKKKEPKPWCPQPNCAAVVEESSTAACSYIGGRSLAVSAADLLGWGNSLVASTQNTLDSQKLSDGKINLGLKIDKSKQPFETAKWREFQLWFCLFTAESPNKNMLQNSKCSIAKSNLQSQIWMVCAIDSLFLLKFRDGFLLKLNILHIESGASTLQKSACSMARENPPALH